MHICMCDAILVSPRGISIASSSICVLLAAHILIPCTKLAGNVLASFVMDFLSAAGVAVISPILRANPGLLVVPNSWHRPRYPPGLRMVGSSMRI